MSWRSTYNNLHLNFSSFKCITFIKISWRERLQFACKNIKYRILTRLHNPITLENIWNKCTVSLPAIHLHKMIKKLYDKRSLDDAWKSKAIIKYRVYKHYVGPCGNLLRPDLGHKMGLWQVAILIYSADLILLFMPW